MTQSTVAESPKKSRHLWIESLSPERLHKWITDNHILSTACAFALEISPSTLNEWKRGRSIPSYENQKKLATLLDNPVPTSMIRPSFLPKEKKKDTSGRYKGRPRGTWIEGLSAEKLRLWRKESGISRRRLGLMLKVAATSIQNWDTNRIVPTHEHQMALLEIMAKKFEKPIRLAQIRMQEPQAISQIVCALIAAGNNEDIETLIPKVRKLLLGDSK